MIKCSGYMQLGWVKKAEIIHRGGPWRSFESVEYATFEWVDWFKNRRLLELIGNSHPSRQQGATTPCWMKHPWQLDLGKLASGNPGVVQPYWLSKGSFGLILTTLQKTLRCA